MIRIPFLRELISFKYVIQFLEFNLIFPWNIRSQNARQVAQVASYHRRSRSSGCQSSSHFGFFSIIFGHMTICFCTVPESTSSWENSLFSVSNFVFPVKRVSFQLKSQNDWVFVQYRWWLFGGTVPWLQVWDSKAIRLLELGAVRDSWRFVCRFPSPIPIIK